MLLLIDAVTTMPLAVTVGPIQAHEVLWARPLVTHARMNVAGASRLAKVVFDQGFWDGTTLWWPDQQGIRFVVPANTHMAVTADTRAQAAAGGGSPWTYGYIRSARSGENGVGRATDNGGGGRDGADDR